MKQVVNFLPYQRRWLEDSSRFKVAMMARQIGKTWTSCAEIVLDCLRAEQAGKQVRWVILSRGERQAREAMRTGVVPFIKAFFEIYHAIEPALNESYENAGGVNYTKLEVSFAGGSRITALPANPDTARGFSANVLLDEFAFHEDSAAIWAAVFPVISSRKDLKLRVISTPNGKGNKFHQLMTAEAGVWSRHQVNIYDAIADGLSRDVHELKQALGDVDAWAQEFELQWLDEASAWLPYDLIATAETAEAGDPPAYGGNDCFIGVDIGRRNDLTVMAVFEQVGDVMICRELAELQRVDFLSQRLELDRLISSYKVRRVCMDATGLGMPVVEEAQRLHGSYMIEGVTFNNSIKHELAIGIKRAFEERKLRIPARRELRDDLHAIVSTRTAAGNVRFDADRNSDGHADRFWAIALALHGASTGIPAFGVTALYSPPLPAQRINALGDNNWQLSGKMLGGGR